MSTSDNLDRYQRILDAAAELFVHYGYDKTTVSDIAREAGISKGAIYLHFDSKDALLEGLIVREMEKFGQSWYDRVQDDPQGGRIGNMYKNMLYALNSSAFMTAMFTQDGRVLGNYLRKPDNFFRRMRAQQTTSNRYEFVKLMQEAGAVRQDIDPKVIAYLMEMIAYSLVGMDDILPEEDIPPIGEVIEGIATFMDRALTPDTGADSETGKTIIRQLMEAARPQFDITQETSQE